MDDDFRRFLDFAGLSDVTITSVGNDEVLAYDTSTSKWINQTASEAGLATASHTHSYLPLTGGTITGSLVVNLDLTVSRTGDSSCATTVDPDTYTNTLYTGNIADGGGFTVKGIAGRAGGAGDTWAIGNNDTNFHIAIGNGSAANTLTSIFTARYYGSYSRREIRMDAALGIGTDPGGTYLFHMIGDSYIDGDQSLSGAVYANGEIVQALRLPAVDRGGLGERPHEHHGQGHALLEPEADPLQRRFNPDELRPDGGGGRRFQRQRGNGDRVVR